MALIHKNTRWKLNFMFCKRSFLSNLTANSHRNFSLIHFHYDSGISRILCAAERKWVSTSFFYYFDKKQCRKTSEFSFHLIDKTFSTCFVLYANLNTIDSIVGEREMTMEGRFDWTRATHKVQRFNNSKSCTFFPFSSWSLTHQLIWFDWRCLDFFRCSLGIQHRQNKFIGHNSFLAAKKQATTIIFIIIVIVKRNRYANWLSL